MTRDVYFFVTLLFHRSNYIEGRVYCQDSNAKQWVPIGFTCPVVCANIRSAIDSLIMSDYKHSLNDKFGNGQRLRNKVLDDNSYNDDVIVNNNNDLSEIDNSVHRVNQLKTECNKDNDINEINANLDTNVNKTKIQSDKGITVDQYEAIFRNVKNVKGILRRSSNKKYINMKTINKMVGKCWYLEKFTPKLLLGKIGYRPCIRKSSFDIKFVQIMTNILNKYADSSFKFTEEMTEILLESIFGTNTDVRNNIFDVNKLLRYLRKSVDLHKNHADGSVVTLKSKRCLTLALPGCFCKPGFVESSGQCVLPSDCVPQDNKQYLSRIIVL